LDGRDKETEAGREKGKYQTENDLLSVRFCGFGFGFSIKKRTDNESN